VDTLGGPQDIIFLSSQASNVLKMGKNTIRKYITDKRVINDDFILEYKKDVEIS
jgi:hypothetical protein